MKNAIENRALREIERGCVEVIGKERLIESLDRYHSGGVEWRVKAGFDPTAADLHLGHAVLLSKLAVMQKHGAIVQFLIGDFTATIGDPTGKSQTRKTLSAEEVAQNAKTYEEQVFKVLDRARTQIVFNSAWLNTLGAGGLIALAREQSVARMLERDDFEKRYRSQTPIAISEFIYPLLQGYDSVHLKSDVELGGSDQKFNLLMGRQLQKSFNVPQQTVMTMPLLEGLDGVSKMSKSLGNYVGLTEPPETMFAKILSISDDLMWRWYELLSAKSLEEIAALKESVRCGGTHPKKAKEELAIEMTSRYHGAAAAQKARGEFDRVHSQNALPEEMEESIFTAPVWIGKAFVEAGLVASTSELKRVLQSRSMKLNGETIDDFKLELQAGEFVAQIGRRKFVRVKVVQR
ncbi:MAG: tyrosine--tRNA ligase [Helicobacteraceae bacterium]|jgi:tyrosyl-tRNA synthetase|nr:tyrosine--tRNA ligase [Helicobacteraceae bacterium]